LEEVATRNAEYVLKILVAAVICRHLIGTHLALRDDRGAIPSWLSGIGLSNESKMQTEHAVGPKSNGADDSGSTI